MKTLIILRHGKAEREAATGRDFDRKLAERGREDAARAGAWLNGLLEPGSPGVVSAAVRTRETAELVAAAGSWNAPEPDPLGYLAEPLFWIQAVSAWREGSGTGLVIGHNPGLSDLVGVLAGEDVWLPTCGAAVLTFSIGSWSEVSAGLGKVREVWTPKRTFVP